MKTFYLIFSAIIFTLGCGGGPRIADDNSYQYEKSDSNKAVPVNINNRYDGASYIFTDGEEKIEISAFQNGIVFAENDAGHLLKDTTFKVAILIAIRVVNLSTKYSFDGFNLGNGYLYDSNGTIWNLIDINKGKKPTELKNCGPGEKVGYDLIFATGAYSNMQELPEKLVYKLVGGFSPDIFRKKFNEELIFIKK